MKRVRLKILAAGLALLMVSSGFQTAEVQAPADRVPVSADFATLRKVVVLSVSDNIFKSSEAEQGRHPFFASGLPRGTIREHAALVRILKERGVQVLDLRDLLQSAIEAARRKGELQAWLKGAFPATAERAIARLDEIDADAILARRKEFFYAQDDQGLFSPIFPGMSSMYWARDFAISTPKGVILGNSRHPGRIVENAIARLIFDHAPDLAGFPVVFDARQEELLLDGGDVIVLDPQTILVGTGNRSSPEVPAMLAQRLGLTVLGVDLPPADSGGGLRRQLLHLDSFFNLIDDHTILAVPYFLEKRYVGSNPLVGVLRGIAAQIEQMEASDSDRDFGNAEAIRATADAAAGIGWVTRYEAGTGAAEPANEKLVDWFRGRGFKVVYVGGEPDAESPVEHFLERAMYELRWQGANVVQLAPREVIAYQHNVHTNQALQRAGVNVATFPGELLSLRNGGPHCLLMPLERGEAQAP